MLKERLAEITQIVLNFAWFISASPTVVIKHQYSRSSLNLAFASHHLSLSWSHHYPELQLKKVVIAAIIPRQVAQKSHKNEVLLKPLALEASEATRTNGWIGVSQTNEKEKSINRLGSHGRHRYKKKSSKSKERIACNNVTHCFWELVGAQQLQLEGSCRSHTTARRPCHAAAL